MWKPERCFSSLQGQELHEALAASLEASIREGSEIAAQVFSSVQVEEAVDPVEAACRPIESSRASHDGVGYLEGEQCRIIRRIELSVENRGERISIGGGPFGVPRECESQEVDLMNKQLVELANVRRRSLKRDDDLKNVGIVGRRCSCRKPVEGGFEWDRVACLRPD